MNQNEEDSVLVIIIVIINKNNIIIICLRNEEDTDPLHVSSKPTSLYLSKLFHSHSLMNTYIYIYIYIYITAVGRCSRGGR
jgi:hypothetical protein